jgi:beta-lactam-binding protein with PASTA domain
MGFFGFLVKKKFYYSLGLAIFLSLIILVISLRIIKSYTHFGEALVLPDFSGMTMQDLQEYKYTDVFDFVVTDSVFANDLPPGSIIMQNPSPHSKVKRGRNVYITTVAMNPEMTVMPDLKDLTVRQALSMLRTHDLKIRKLLFIDDMADNAVLGHYFNGDTLLAGEELLSGSQVDLLIGQSDNNKGPVPFLVGREEQNALEMILTSSFNIGRVRYWDSLAMLEGRVYRQSPEWTEELEKGETISIWLRSPLQLDFDSLVETLLPDTVLMEDQIPQDSVFFEE